MRIIQLCEVVNYGDGVGNDMLRKAELFRELGYSCEIYAKTVHRRLKGQAHPIDELAVQPGDILLHHYAGYSDLVDWIRHLPCVKVLIYHNITPPELLKGELRSACEQGIRQLPQLRGQYDFYVGVSAYNVSDMEKYGLAASYDVLPIAIDLPPVDSGARRRSRRRRAKGTSFLFVGRIARNKMQDALLRVFNQYWEAYDQSASLTLVGDIEADPMYYQEIYALLDTLPSKRNVRLTGKVSARKLRQAYENADAYVSLSRHEGFGIPMLEAMQYQIPVFALRSSAVEETLGGAGVLLETDEPGRAAAALHEVMADGVRCKAVIQRQNERIQSFSPEAVKKRMQELVNKWSADSMEASEDQTVYRWAPAEKASDAERAQSEAAAPAMAESRPGTGMHIEQMRSLAENYAHRPLYSCRKFLGRFIVLGKRILRKLFKWYLEPVCVQQTQFNRMVVDAVSHLQEEQAQIAQRCVSVMQEDAHLVEQLQRMQTYLDRLDASGIPIFRPEQGIRWGDNKMSQDGTDAIVSTITSLLGIPLDQVSYLDLGANHAVELSSTYFFYKNGARGVLVEANPALIPELQILRSGDMVIGRAVAAKSGEKISFYVVPGGDGLSSASKSWVQNCLSQSEALGQAEEIQVDTITVNEILEHFCRQTPVFVDLDIEGMELEILRTFDFQKYRPLVFAVEMVPFRFGKLVLKEKNEEIMALMERNGYVEYAFTGINSIFVDRSRLV